MIQIAVVKKNKIVFEDDDMRKYIVPLLYTYHEPSERKKIKTAINNYIWSVIEPYVKFINIDPDNLLDVTCPILGKPYPNKPLDNFMYFAEPSFSFPKKHFEFLYSVPGWKDYNKSVAESEDINILACLFSLKHTVMVNTCVIYSYKYNLDKEKKVEFDSIYRNDIIKLVKARYFHSAILISQNSMKKYYYQAANIDFLIKTIFGNVTTIENSKSNLINYNLSFYFQLDKSKYVNEIATRLNGMYRLYGDVLVLHQDQKDLVSNINVNELRNLNILSFGRLYDRELKEEEMVKKKSYGVDNQGKEIEKEEIVMWCKYLVVMGRLNKKSLNYNICINCNKKMISPIICNKCFRIKYCSKECQNEYRDYHIDECINPKSY